MMEQFKQAIRILVFIVKVGIGIFDEVSDIVYYFYQPFPYNELRSSMLFFLLLSPIIQTIAWSILLAQMKSEAPRPSNSDRVKRSKSFCEYILNYIFSTLEYYIRIFISMLKHIPMSLAITVLQEIKIFPFCLFGYTYYKYKAILTRDLMKNLAPHLFLFQQIVEDEEHEKLISASSPSGTVNLQLPMSPMRSPTKLNINKPNANMEQIMTTPQVSGQPQPQRRLINLQPILQSSVILEKKEDYTSIQTLNEPNNLRNPLIQTQETDLDEKGVSGLQIFKKLGQLKVKPVSTNPDKDLMRISEQSPVSQKSNFFGNSVLLLPEQKREDSYQVPSKSGSPRKGNRNGSSVDPNSSQSEASDHMFNMSNISPRRRVTVFSMSRQLFLGPSAGEKINPSAFRKSVLDTIKLPIVSRDRSISGILKRTNTFQTLVAPQQQQQMHHSQQKESQEPLRHQDSERNRVFNETDLLLDANIVPTVDHLLADRNLEQFLLITDVIEAFFEALPMTVIQYINNGMNSSWQNSDGSWNFFLVFTFVTSVAMIITHGISLLKLLYDENIQTFYCTLQFLEKFRVKKEDQIDEEGSSQIIDSKQQQKDQENQKNDAVNKQGTNPETPKKKKGEGFSRIFPMSSDIKIENYMQLSKLEVLRNQACEEIKFLIFDFDSFPYQAQLIMSKIENALNRIKTLNKIEVHFNGNNLLTSLHPTIQQILNSQSNLKSFVLTIYDTVLNGDNAYQVYKILNSWILKKEGNVDEVLLENQTIFFWRCPHYQTSYPHSSTLGTKLDNLLSADPERKEIVEIDLPDKELSNLEIADLIPVIRQWENLKHFQLVCKSIPFQYTSMLADALDSIPCLQSSLVVSEKQGLIHKKGFSSVYSPNKEYESETNTYNSFELENNSFYFNMDAMKYIFTQELKPMNSMATEAVIIHLEQKSMFQKRFREYSLKNLLTSIENMRILKVFSLYLQNNELGYLAGQPIGKCIESLSKIQKICLNLNENHLGSNGFYNLISPLVKSQRRFKSIELNLSRNLISNEGALHLISLLRLNKPESSDQSMLQLGQYDRIEMGQIQFKTLEKQRMNLEYLHLDLSNNRLQRDILDRLMEMISQLHHLQSLQLKLTGNIIAVTQPFDFSTLCQLRVLGLTFWCNDFSDTSLNLIFKSMRSCSALQELYFHLICNNMHSNLAEYPGHLDHLSQLRKLQLIYSKNGEALSSLHDIDMTLLQLRNLKVLQLDLSSCNFSRMGIATITRNLEYFSVLEELDLNFSYNPLFDDECSTQIMESISSLFMMRQLALNYQSTRITDVTTELVAKSIVIMVCLRTVVLDFQHNDTTDLSMKCIVASLVQSTHILHPQFFI